MTGEPHTTGGAAGSDPPGQSTAQLVRDIVVDVGELVHKEVELARQETVEAVTARAQAVAAFAIAGVLGLIATVFLAAAAAEALEHLVAAWAARLVVAGGLLLVAGLAVALGVPRLKKPPLTPARTIASVKEDVSWARAQLKR